MSQQQPKKNISVNNLTHMFGTTMGQGALQPVSGWGGEPGENEPASQQSKKTTTTTTTPSLQQQITYPKSSQQSTTTTSTTSNITKPRGSKKGGKRKSRKARKTRKNRK